MTINLIAVHDSKNIQNVNKHGDKAAIKHESPENCFALSNAVVIERNVGVALKFSVQIPVGLAVANIVKLVVGNHFLTIKALFLCMSLSLPSPDQVRGRAFGRHALGLFDKAVDDAFFTGFLERDCQLVARDVGYCAIAEFLVENAAAELET